jgi:uncharacterized Zn finger protein (UPF0148 family)
MKNCPKCNAELRPGAMFCHVCGYQIPDQHEETPVQQQPVENQMSNQTTNLNQINMENQQQNEMPVQATGLVQRIINIITKPKQEWEVIQKEIPETKKILTSYVIPLMLIPTVAQIIGLGLIGKKVGMGFWSVNYKSWEWGLTTGITTFVAGLISLYVVALVVDLLAPSFGSEKNFGRSFQLVAYAWTPAWVAGVFHIIPALGIIATLAGIYGLVLLYMGIAPLKKTPADKVAVYFIISLLVVIVVSVVIALVLGLISAAIWAPSVGLRNFSF